MNKTQYPEGVYKINELQLSDKKLTDRVSITWIDINPNNIEI